MPNNNADELKKLLDILPARVKKHFDSAPDLEVLVEIILDLGRPVEIRFSNRELYLVDDLCTREDIDYVVSKVGRFTSDNRAGIAKTLHRISAVRNRQGEIVGLTCRVGRAIFGTIDIIRDIVESGQNILIMGPPGIGKTTVLREVARILADQLNKRVVVVDTSNEIAGDGDIPHTGIGRSRRMQVPSPDQQHKIMIEAVENHMPEVIIVDEIGTEEEALAARTIAERGVQLVGTAHGNYLENIVSNPTLSDLVGGVQTVILGDDEAKRRHTQKSVLERKAPPTFGITVEIRERNMFAIYPDVSIAVDRLLQGFQPNAEVRVRTAEGKIEVKQKAHDMPEVTAEQETRALLDKESEPLKIYPFAVHKGQLERGISVLQLPAMVVGNLNEADIILTTKPKAKPNNKVMKLADQHHIPVHVIRKNVSSQIMRFLKYYFKTSASSHEEAEDVALREAESAVEQVKNSGKSTDLNPQNAYIRRLQHQYIQKQEFRSESVGEEPRRRVRVYSQ